MKSQYCERCKQTTSYPKHFCIKADAIERLGYMFSSMFERQEEFDKEYRINRDVLDKAEKEVRLLK